MSEITKDFLKFIIEVLLFVIVLAVLFSDQGIASNTANYIAFVEPIVLQNWISSAVTTGGSAPGEFMTTTKTTGQPLTISLYVKNGMNYIHVVPLTVYATKFASLDEMPVVSNCKLPDLQTINIQRSLIQTIVVRKYINSDGSCSIEISAPTNNIVVGPVSGVV